MSSVIDLDLYRDCHLIVEGEPLVKTASPTVIRWTITGEKQETVDKAANKLMRLTITSRFSFPAKLPRDHPRYPWFQTVGYTSDEPGADVHSLLLRKERQ